MYIDDEKRSYVIKQCIKLEHTAGAVRVSRVMSLLGLLSFCACVLEGMRPRLRSGFDMIKDKQPRDFVPLSRGFRLDLAYIRRLFDQATPRTMLVKRPLTTVFGSWDASTSWGMGGFLDERRSDFLVRRGHPSSTRDYAQRRFTLRLPGAICGLLVLETVGQLAEGTHSGLSHRQHSHGGHVEELVGHCNFHTALERDPGAPEEIRHQFVATTHFNQRQHSSRLLVERGA